MNFNYINLNLNYISMHYYRIEPETEVGRSLNSLLIEGTRCVNEAAKLAANEFHADSFTPSTRVAMGGIGQLFFRRKPTSRRWEILGKTSDGLYCVIPNPGTRSGCMVVEKLIKLPVVSNKQVVEAFGIKTTSDIVLPKFFAVENIVYVCSCYEINNPALIAVTEEEYLMAMNYFEGV